MRVPKFFLVMAGVGLAACATAPKPEVDGVVSALTPAQVRESGTTGERVRWGGSIVEVKPGKSDTCVEVLARPLDDYGRPNADEPAQGRFLACQPGLLDPAAYPAGRDFSVVGTVLPAVRGRIGEHEVLFPRLQAEKLYLWPPAVYAVPAYYYDPWWGWPPRRYTGSRFGRWH